MRAGSKDEERGTSGVVPIFKAVFLTLTARRNVTIKVGEMKLSAWRETSPTFRRSMNNKPIRESLRCSLGVIVLIHIWNIKYNRD